MIRPEGTESLPRRPLALVTGATSGIGLAVARDLARDHDLVLVSRSSSRLEALAQLLGTDRAAPGSPTVRLLPVDLTDDEALADAVQETDLEALDVLVHCAGTEASGTLEELTPARWREVLSLNLVSVAHLTTLLLPSLRRAEGLVVMVNSGAGQHAYPGQALYCASKAGLRALADSLRQDEQGRLRVTTVYPGRVDTPMQERIQAARAQRYRAEDHMTPQSVASAVRLAVETPRDAVVEDLTIRPAGLL